MKRREGFNSAALLRSATAVQILYVSHKEDSSLSTLNVLIKPDMYSIAAWECEIRILKIWKKLYMIKKKDPLN